MKTNARRVGTALIVAASLSLLVPTGLTADTRTEKIDIMILLDKSLSMEEEISAVVEYVNDTIVENIAIPGDRLLIIGFYGKTEVLVNTVVGEETAKPELVRRLGTVAADGRFTDIGNALDELLARVEAYQDDGRRKYLLLLTDGKQEAPPESKYYSPDGSFTHHLLENTRTIRRAGWKIHILGIGTSELAEQLAEELSAEYTEVRTPESDAESDEQGEDSSSSGGASDAASGESGTAGETNAAAAGEEPSIGDQLSEATSDFYGMIEVVESPVVSPVGNDGRARLSLTVENTYRDDKAIAIRAVALSAGSDEQENILRNPAEYTVPSGERMIVDVPVEISIPVDPSGTDGELVFDVGGNVAFAPLVFDTTLTKQGFIQSYIWLVPVVLVVLAALLLLLLRVLRPRDDDRQRTQQV